MESNQGWEVKKSVENPPVSAGFEISNNPEELIERTGTIWTAIAHVITGVIGAGVLSLAWSVAQLGWVAGPIVIVIFAAITQVSTLLVCDCYRSPDPENGPTRNRSFMQAVKFYLGKTKQRICAIFVLQSFYGCGIAYTIVTASSVKAILRSNCYHDEGKDAKCDYGNNIFMLIFGLTQIVVSQIPNFHNMAWLSIIAAIMSFSYAFIGFGLGFATVIENRQIKGSIRGVSAPTSSQKMWLVFQALADIAFSYPYTQIVLEIQDTLRSPPPQNRTMKKATIASILITTFFYLCCACFGYAAFGDHTPGNLLTGFGFYEPYWLYPQNKFINKFYACRLPMLPSFKLNMLSLCFRTVYVMSTTGLAMLFPYFNQVLGVLGALNFWPVAIYFPVEMYFVQSKTQAWTRKWVALQKIAILVQGNKMT
ncbi:amino acid transporter [Striga asiatica]|uniref:Amino acid transporter n=1 Tax=Striga asiatica TaxID=4170 RepID=A0A5A7QL27_STRAF|nr:amino acid transporter [Striga asiatica]